VDMVAGGYGPPGRLVPLPRSSEARHDRPHVHPGVWRRPLGDEPQDPAVGLHAQVEGYTTAFTWAAGLLVLGAVATAVLVRATKDDVPAERGPVHVG
jgi:hypothetical protein